MSVPEHADSNIDKPFPTIYDGMYLNRVVKALEILAIFRIHIRFLDMYVNLVNGPDYLRKAAKIFEVPYHIQESITVRERYFAMKLDVYRVHYITKTMH